MSIKLGGVTRVVDGVRRFEERMFRNIKQAVMDAAFVVEGEAKRRAPVKTGRLRMSIRSRLDKATPNMARSVVETGPCAAARELGHKHVHAWGKPIPPIKVRPFPFLFPAFQASYGRIREIMRGVRV